MLVGHICKSKDKESGSLFLQGVSNKLLLKGEVEENFRKSVGISYLFFTSVLGSVEMSVGKSGYIFDFSGVR